jgi:hypothetical protein
MKYNGVARVEYCDNERPTGWPHPSSDEVQRWTTLSGRMRFQSWRTGLIEARFP